MKDFEDYYRKHRRVMTDCSRLSQTLMLDCIERNDPHDQWCASCLDYERCSGEYDSERNDDMR